MAGFFPIVLKVLLEKGVGSRIVWFCGQQENIIPVKTEETTSRTYQVTEVLPPRFPGALNVKDVSGDREPDSLRSCY